MGKINFKKWLQKASLVIEFALFCQALVQFVFNVEKVDLLFYGITYYPTSNFYLLPGALLGLLATLSHFARNIEKAGRSLWLLLPLLFFPQYFITYILYIGIIGWSTYRYGRILRSHCSGKLTWSLPRWALPGGVGLLTLAVGVWYYFLQQKAFYHQLLPLGDWGQYAQAYLRLAFATDIRPVEYLIAAGHWNPAVNLIMTGLIKLSPCPQTIFAVNALLLSSAIGLGAWLSQEKRLPAYASGIVALLIALNPAFSHQALALFYGFHPINFFIPVLLLFFIFQERQNKWGKWGCLFFSFFIQETVAVFWGGYAVYLLLRKKWRTGSILWLLSCIFFVLITLKVIPWGGTDQQLFYPQNFHYSQLGSNLTEILLSPILRPEAFGSILFQSNNFYFILLLILPFILILKPFPLLLFAGLPLLGGIILQESAEMKSIVLQYSVELTTLLVVVMILQLQQLPRKRLPATLSGLLIIGLLSYHFFGLAFYGGKYPTQQLDSHDDCREVVQFFRSKIPPQAKLQTSLRWLPHFMFDLPAEKFRNSYRTGDYLLLDLHDHYFEFPKDQEKLRYKLLKDPLVVPVAVQHFDNRNLILFAVKSTASPRYFNALPVCPQKNFDKIPQRLKSNDPNFELALISDRAHKLHVLVRLKNPVRYDVDLLLKLSPDPRPKLLRYTFGAGCTPAYAQKAGAIWGFKLPENTLNEIGVLLMKRPGSDLDER